MFDDVEIGEVQRKMMLVCERYKDSTAVQHIPLAIRKAHQTLFGLSVVSGEGKFHHSLERSRKGLVVLEKTLVFLNLPIKEEKLRDVLLRGGEKGAKWAKSASKEWSNKSESGQGWMPSPALLCFVKANPSTFRIVAHGLEAMGLVQSRRVSRRNRPTRYDTSTRAYTITMAGQDFLKELER